MFVSRPLELRGSLKVNIRFKDVYHNQLDRKIRSNEEVPKQNHKVENLLD
jgi:hypothetical protein